MLKVSPRKGVISFGKLNSWYIGPFKIFEWTGPMAYKLELLEELRNIHNTFHVSNLKKCLFDESLVILMKELWLDDKLNFVEEPMEIMDRKVKQLRQIRIPIIKVRWNSKTGAKFTWEREDEIRSNNSDTDKIMAGMDAISLKMDAQYKELQSNANKTNHDLDEDDIPMSHEEEAKFKLVDKQSGRPSGSLPSNTQPNPKVHSSKAYQPPQSRNEHVNVVFTRSDKSYNPPVNPNDQQTNSETPINFDSDDEEEEEPTPELKTQNPKPVKETPLPKPYKPKIPYPQRLRKEKMEAQYIKFLDMIRVV
ncbi:hypothetical protein Tco_0419264 [Tanacetum coccineum]